MRELIADLFISVDGFASGENQPPYFGYFGPELDQWIREQLDQPQVIIMGRATYQALVGFSVAARDAVSRRMTNLPKLVVSNTLEEPLVWKNTRLLKGDLADKINALKEEPGARLRCIGSISLVRCLLQLRLVDRLRLMMFPLTLGSAGREPIYERYPRLGLELVGTKVVDARLVLLEYRPLRD